MDRADGATTKAPPGEQEQPERPRAARVLLLSYAGFAIVVVVVLSSDSRHGFAQSASIAFFLVAGAVSLVLGLLESRGHALRRIIIGFESLLVPTQVAISVLSDVVLLGLILSIAVLVRLRPVCPRLSQGLRKFFLTLHVGFSVSWLGASMAMVILSVTGLVTTNLELRHHAYVFMHIFDLTIVIPLVLLSIITGLVISLGTHWGLVRYWWILAKFVLALGIVAFAGVQENFWVRGLAARTAKDRGADLGGIDLQLAVCMVVFCIVLWTATILSIYKPWGRTRWGELSLARGATSAKTARRGHR